jgi:hypothetical protein
VETRRVYTSAVAFETALSARLLAISKDQGIEYQRLRREVAYDRFLARLKHVAPEQWLLKGGVALDLRFARAEARRTKDIDIETRVAHTLEEATEFIQGAAAADLQDFFSFAITKLPTAPIIEDVPAFRFTIEARIGKKMFEGFSCDVGVADENIGEPEVVQSRDLLLFAGIEPAVVLAVPLFRHMADKLHAYVRLHNGIVSSRAKDLVDLALVTAHRRIQSAGALRAALDRVFKLHDAELPKSFPPPPANWARSYPVVAEGIAVPGDYLEAHKIVATMLDPVLANAIAADRVWNPERQAWEAR